MSVTYSAGRFVVEVSPPAPQWVSLKTDDNHGDPIKMRLHPDSLPDLLHVLNRAVEHIARNDRELRK